MIALLAVHLDIELGHAVLEDRGQLDFNPVDAGIAGGEDRIHPPATVQRTAALLGADFQVFPDMSHWLIGEPGWESVAQACMAWAGREKRVAA